MSPDQVDLFLDSVRRVGLLSDGEVESLSDELRSDAPTCQEEVAARLVARRVLTDYQVQRLLAGQGDDCVLASRYHLLEPIGAGGMGSVFKARDVRDNQFVAVKVMASHRLDNPDAVARFKREARALAHLTLPNVVRAFDSGEDRGRHFLVMEWVPGVSLKQLLADRGKIPPTVAADYIYQTAVGMQGAHERHLIHRDLKPANLLLTPDGQIKILDLGLARFLQDQVGDGTITREFVGLGTPDYMPPEQYRDARHVDVRADIYSLGCTLYHLLTGVVPFPGSSMSDKAHAHEHREPPPLEERCPDIPAGLAVVVERTMAKRPADRYQTMRQLADALAPYVAGSSPSLPQVKHTASWYASSVLRGRKQSTWLKVAGAVAAGIALVMGTLAVSGFFSRAPNDGELAETTSPNHQEPTQANDSKTREQPSEPPKAEEPRRIADGLTVAQDGSADCTTIREALARVKPGQRIRVLDDAVYKEPLVIDIANKHQGIRLEAPKHATLEMQSDTIHALLIRDVANVRVSGFRLRDNTSRMGMLALLMVRGRCPGVVLEDLDLQIDKQHVFGIVVLNTGIPADQPPVVVRKCRVAGARIGITLNGLSAAPASNIIISDNAIEKCITGISFVQDTENVIVSGNIIWNCESEAIQLNNPIGGEGSVLLANNTCYRNRFGLLVGHSPPYVPFKENQFQICNNIILESEHGDMVFTKLAGAEGEVKPGDGKFLLDLWKFHDNRRDLAGGYGKDKLLPLAEADRQLEADELISRDYTHEDFLRPQPSSPLANQGAGKTDSSLPAYVGAVPPRGGEPWDWNDTWEAWGKKSR